MIKFTTSIKKINESIKRDAHAQIKDIANDLFRRIVTRNPVDTGFSSSNWNIGYAANFKTRGSKKSPPQIVNKLQNTKKIPSNMKSIHISNGVNYIDYLEQGTATQAPRQFVALSVAEIRAKHGS